MPKKILRLPQVVARTGQSRMSIWRQERAGRFPLRVRLGPNSVGWIEEEIDAHLAALPRGCIPVQPNSPRKATA